MNSEIFSLQETVDRRLGITDMPDSRRFANTGGELHKANRMAAERELARFDALNNARLMSEYRQLAGGSGVAADAAVPAIYQRTVIREALYNMIAMELVDFAPMAFASSVSIPYSYRDSTAAGRNSSRVYEGEEIPRAGVIQTTDLAYPIPQKLAFEVTDELRHLTGAQHLNWDGVAENMANAQRIIQEDTDAILLNEMLRSSDEFGAVTVSNEDLELQADGTKRVFLLAHFPVVRPRATYNLQGQMVGGVSNSITVSYNSIEREEFDGTGTQAAGIYWVLNYNMGEVHLVDESGAILIPANGTAYAISYSYATNVYVFDTDEGTTEAGDHWDKFLYRYGLRKAAIDDDRHFQANFGLMSGTAMSQIEQAKKFAANFRVPGSNLSEDGTLGQIKGIANWKTSGPGLHFRDERVLIGQKGITRYRLLKPWEMSRLESQRGPTGRFTGKKEAYGDQFIAVHTPTPLKGAYSSLVLYSATARVARVDP